MNKSETLKQEILNSVKPVSYDEQWFCMSGEITRETVQEALKIHKCVEIPDIGKPVELDGPIVLSSDHHLKVAENQLIRQTEECQTCLVRNENIQNGAFSMPDGRRDKNISIQGGIWHTTGRSYTDHERSVRGSLGIIILCCVEQVLVSGMKFVDSSSYAVQICDCKDFTVENIHFENYHKDGIHVNGPADYGIIRHLTGSDMGDDMVALNAWDWITSAITFGSITHLYVDDIESNTNEFRLLPGQKIFDDGTMVDCDIRDCVLENISGIYTFKLYAQPNIANAIRRINDVSGTVGTIENVYFKNISFVKVQPSGFHGLPVKSLFEICADCNELYMENVTVENTIEECDHMDLRLINVGPLSAVWTNNSDNPDDWGEVFDPDAICTADNIHLKNISFAGSKVTDAEKLTREVHMTINPNYPKATPRGGTGYGKIGKVDAE